MKATVRTDYGYLRVRAGPGYNYNIIGIVHGGLTVDVISVTDGWATVPLQAGGSPINVESTDQLTVGYMYAPMLDFGVQSPPMSPPTFHLGVHSMVNNSGADEANRGCKYVMCMNLAVANQIKAAHPDAVVMLRIYYGNNVPSVSAAIAAMGGCTNPGLVYTGLNESDAIGQDGDALRRRAQFDVAMAQAIKKISGATYAAGSFSVGTPDYTNPNTCAIMRDYYAPYYNNGLLKMDMHLYSPSMPHLYDDSGLKWYERRWEFLFTSCGFDPNVKGIYCSETGVDEPGSGGFAGHRTSQTDFSNWCQRFIAVQKRPVVVNGVSYTSPVVGGSIFQLGGNGDARWNAYDISGYLPTLRTLY